MLSIGWILFALLLGAIELFSLTFILLWVALSAFFTGLFGLFMPSLAWQVGFFVILSIALLLFTWRFGKRMRNRPSRFRSRIDELAGVQAQVVEGWAPGGSGLVKIRGEVWSAIGNAKDVRFEKDDWVLIVAVETTQLIVERIVKGGDVL